MATMVDSIKGLGKVKMAVMAAVAVAMIGFFALIALRVSAPAYSPIYSGLSLQDSAKIVSELEKQGVPYELRGGGGEILVPNDRVLRLRMTMAEQGLPSNGSVVGNEIFDKQETFGSSNFVMNVNAMRAMEGELARTIGSFSQVETARVHLVIPKRELFSRDKQEPTASVWLKLQRAQELTKNEVAAITHLVASAVPGLKVSKVTVVDSFGHLLARGDGDESIGALASSSDEYKVAFENRTRQTVEDLLERVVGMGRVKVQVAADINFDRIVTNSEKYDPEGQVARSVQSNNEKETSNEKEGSDAVTVGNQVPNANASKQGGGPSAQRQTEKNDETTNYEISKTTQNHVKEGGTVNKISVAVLVDGNYTTDADGKQTYAPRSEEELKRLEALVKTAIGFDEKRGDTVELVNMQFDQPKEEALSESFLDKFRTQMGGIIQTLIIAVVVLLAILLVVRPATMHMIKNSSSPAERTADGLAALESPEFALRLPGTTGTTSSGLLTSGASGGEGGELQFEEDDSLVGIQNMKGRIRSSTVKKVSEMVDKNTDESVNVVRQWMMKEAS